MEHLQIPCMRANQNGRTLYVCTIRAKELADLYNRKIIAVDVWSPQNPDGYQRMPVVTRARKYARYVANRGVTPTSVLMYLRDLNNGVKFKDGILTIPKPNQIEKPLLYLVDGQHRTLGLSEGFEQGYFDNKIELDIPVVILTKGPMDPYIEEASQFVTINTEQKRVRTDLANQQLLKIRSALKDIINKDSLMEIGSKKEITPYATAITNFLTEDIDSPWYEKIVRPSTPRASSGLPSQGQFEDSLLDAYIGDSIIGYGISAGYTVGELVTVLKNYWGAIFEIIPGAIERPEEYYVTKTIGIHALNALLPSIFHIKRLSKIPDKNEFFKVLSKIELLAEQYWVAKGEVSTYGGGKSAFKTLTIDLHKQLLQ